MEPVYTQFRLEEVTRLHCHQQKNGWHPIEGVRVKLSPILEDPLASAIPSGVLEMVVGNQKATEVFRNAPIGATFCVAFSLVEEKSEEK